MSVDRPHLSRRQFLRISAAAATGAVLVACTPDSSSQTNNNGTAAPEKVTPRVTSRLLTPETRKEGDPTGNLIVRRHTDNGDTLSSLDIATGIEKPFQIDSNVLVLEASASPSHREVAVVQINMDYLNTVQIIDTRTGSPNVDIQIGKRTASNPVWSTAGGFIAFTEDRRGNDDSLTHNIQIMETGHGEPLSEIQNARDPQFAPATTVNDKIIAYTTSDKTVIIADLFDAQKNITVGEGERPKWSTSGRFLAYERASEDQTTTDIQIYDTAVDDPNRSKFPSAIPNAIHPVWSPDERSMLITELGPNLGDTALTLVDAASGQEKRKYFTNKSAIHDYKLSGDSGWIFVISEFEQPGHSDARFIND